MVSPTYQIKKICNIVYKYYYNFENKPENPLDYSIHKYHYPVIHYIQPENQLKY